MKVKKYPGTAGTVHGEGEQKAGDDLMQNNTQQPSKRQQLKQIIVWLAVHGIVPIPLAEWLIRRGGMS